MSSNDDRFKIMSEACCAGDLETVQRLLESSSYDVSKSIDWTDKDQTQLNSPPLIICIDYGHVDLVRALAAASTKDQINSPDDNGYTPLHWASWNGNLKVVQILVEEYAATADEEALDLAKEHKHPEVVKYLQGRVDLYSNIDPTDVDALMLQASKMGDAAMVQKLLDQGYDIHKWKKEDGSYQEMSPVFVAHRGAHIDVIRLFLEAGLELEWRAEDNEES